MPFRIKNINITVWTLKTHPDLLPYEATIKLFYGPAVELEFESKETAVEALKDPGKSVPMSFRVGTKPLAKTETSINQCLADLANHQRRAEHAPFKKNYSETQDAAEQKGAELFATKNDPQAFVKNKCTYYFQGAYMSGDQFAVGAALTHDPQSRLILLYQLGEETAARRLLKFYGASCRLTSDRLLLVQVPDSKSACKACGTVVDHRIKNEPCKISVVELQFLEGINRGAILCPVGRATTDVAASVLKPNATGMLVPWDNVDPNTNRYWAYRIDKFLWKQGVEKFKDYVIVWTRFSGKDGGAHPELDDSWTGLGQVCRGLLERGVRVIVVGRPRFNKDIKEKMATHLNRLDAEQGAVNRTHLQIWGEYWKNDEGAPRQDTIGPHRAAEYGIFLRMISKEWSCRLVHLGMRSGAMDAAALLGMRTRFIEDEHNQQIGRTTKWTGEDNANRLYQRIPVKELPTWRARKDVYQQQSPEPQRGYLKADLELILASVMSAF